MLDKRVICKCGCVSCGACQHHCLYTSFTHIHARVGPYDIHVTVVTLFSFKDPFSDTSRFFDNFIFQKTLVGSSLCFGAQTAKVLVCLCTRHPRPSPTVWPFVLSWHTTFIWHLWQLHTCVGSLSGPSWSICDHLQQPSEIHVKVYFKAQGCSPGPGIQATLHERQRNALWLRQQTSKQHRAPVSGWARHYRFWHRKRGICEKDHMPGQIHWHDCLSSNGCMGAWFRPGPGPRLCVLSLHSLFV